MNSIYCAGGSRLTLDWQNPLIFCGIGAQSGERIDAAFRPRSRGRAAQLAFAIHLSAGPGNSQRAARFHCHRISPAFSLAMPAEPRRHGRRQFYPAIWTAAKVAGEVAWDKPTPRIQFRSKGSLRGSASDERLYPRLARSHPSFGYDLDDKQLADLARGCVVLIHATLDVENYAWFAQDDV